MKLSTLKKHIAYISMIDHFYTDMKVSSNEETMVNTTKFYSFLLWLDMHMNDFLNLRC